MEVVTTTLYENTGKIKTKRKEEKEIEKHKIKEQQKKSKKIKRQKIVGTKKFIDSETGEMIECSVVEKNVEQDFNFFKVWLMDLLNILELVGTKKMKVVNYIFDNLNTTENIFIGTHEEIARKLNVSRVVVSQTFKILLESNLLVKRTGGVYMLNPEILVKGTTGKRIHLMVKYNEIKNNK